MTRDQREIRRKLRILEHAEATGKVAKTCRYFGIGRASLYRWRQAYRNHGEAGLVNKRSVPHNHPNKTPPEVAEKVLHLRRKHHLGPMRIVWFTEHISGGGDGRDFSRTGPHGEHAQLCTTGPAIAFAAQSKRDRDGHG